MINSTPINQRIKVLVKFDPVGNYGKIFPVAMEWQNRTIKFKNLIFKSTHRVGEKRFTSLICQSDSANFELEFDAESYTWWLKKILSKD